MAPALGLTAGLPAIEPAHAQSATERLAWRHGLSLFGDVKYPADFKRFDYVNPDAPKGGVARQISIGTFDNFNLVVAGVKGSLAAGVALIYETLMTPVAGRGLDRIRPAGRSASAHPDDFSLVIYRLRAGGEMARRQAGDAGGRDLLARCA